MLAGRLQARDGALGRPHAGRHLLLSKACLQTRGQKLTNESVFVLEFRVSLAKALAAVARGENPAGLSIEPAVGLE